MDNTIHFVDRWDMIIAHPPCTYLTVSGNRWFDINRYGDAARQRYKDRYNAIVFFMQMALADAEKIAVENPIGIMNTCYRKADQIIQPYMFGHPYAKSTCLWLKNLPPLMPTQWEEPERIHSKGKSGGYSGPAWMVKDENGKALTIFAITLLVKKSWYLQKTIAHGQRKRNEEMDNKEAIKALEANYPDACYEQLREAVDAAIKALGAQDAEDDAISRRAALEACYKGWNKDYKEIAQDIKDLPPAQPKGHWIQISPAGIYECSECGKNVKTNDIEAYEFCHGCGADMRGGAV